MLKRKRIINDLVGLLNFLIGSDAPINQADMVDQKPT